MDFFAEILGCAEGLIHELLNVLGVNPGGAQANLDFRGVQVPWDDGGQGVHVDLKGRVLPRGFLSLTELFAHVAGQVLVGGLPVAEDRVSIDYASEFCNNFSFGLTGEPGHVPQVYPAPLPDGDGDGVRGRVHVGDRMVLFYGSLGEHIGLALQPAVVIQNFQGTQKIVGRIPVEGQAVGPVVDKAVLPGVGIIEPVQFGLLGLEGAVRGVLVHL